MSFCGYGKYLTYMITLFAANGKKIVPAQTRVRFAPAPPLGTAAMEGELRGKKTGPFGRSLPFAAPKYRGRMNEFRGKQRGINPLSARAKSASSAKPKAAKISRALELPNLAESCGPAFSSVQFESSAARTWPPSILTRYPISISMNAMNKISRHACRQNDSRGFPARRRGRCL